MAGMLSFFPTAVHWDLALHHPGLLAAHYRSVLPGIHPGEPSTSCPGAYRTWDWSLPEPGTQGTGYLPLWVHQHGCSELSGNYVLVLK